MRLAVALLGSLALLAAPAGAASIAQLPGTAGCLAAAGADPGCAPRPPPRGADRGRPSRPTAATSTSPAAPTATARC